LDLKDIVVAAPEHIKNEFIYKQHNKGSSIVLPDEANDYLYILIKGRAEVYSQSYSGSYISLYLFESYSCFGEVEIFNNQFKTLGVIAKSDCETISINKNAVIEWIKADINFTLYLIEQLSEKLIHSTNTTAKLSLLTVKDRVLDSIYIHYKIGDLDRMTKEKLSYEVCVPMRSLNRAIAQCIDEGLIDIINKKIIVKSKENLEKNLNFY
jgi:CRP-like cAMP-binding protein